MQDGGRGWIVISSPPDMTDFMLPPVALRLICGRDILSVGGGGERGGVFHKCGRDRVSYTMDGGFCGILEMAVLYFCCTAILSSAAGMAFTDKIHHLSPLVTVGAKCVPLACGLSKF